jgi:hypothetical protein
MTARHLMTGCSGYESSRTLIDEAHQKIIVSKAILGEFICLRNIADSALSVI